MDSINVKIIHCHDIENNWKDIGKDYEPLAGEMLENLAPAIIYIAIQD